MNNKDGLRMTTERMTYCMGCMKAFPKGKDQLVHCVGFLWKVMIEHHVAFVWGVY